MTDKLDTLAMRTCNIIVKKKVEEHRK